MPEDEEIKPQTGEESNDTSNQDEETDSESSEDLSKFFGDDETSDEDKEKAQKGFLETFNKMSGKNFKSVDALVKSMKEADKAFAKAGTRTVDKEEKADTDKKSGETTKSEPVKVPKVIETLYFDSRPEAKLVWKEVEKAARLTGRDPFELYESEEFFKEKAKVLYEEKHGEEENKSKVKDPSFQGGAKKGSGSSKVTLSEADRALLRRRGLTEKDVKFN